MKRYVFICIVMLLGYALVAAPLAIGVQKGESKNVVDVSLSDGSSITIGRLGKDFIGVDFSALSSEDRLFTFEEAKVPVTWPAIKGALLGFGTGAMSQHDAPWAIFGIVADSATLASFTIGVVLEFVDVIILGIFGQSPGSMENDKLHTLGKGLVLGGAIGFGVSRLVQAVVPIIKGTTYNKNLRQALLLDKTPPKIGFEPVLTPLGTLAWQGSVRIAL